MDTRFWGPSAWQLFHMISFLSEHPQDVLRDMKDVLPCAFCRESTNEFVKKHPLKGDPGKWLYEIHNMVNNKLRTQCAEDPAIIDPGPDPTFEEVKKRYLAMKPTAVPGRDFLFSIAYNFPEKPEPAQVEVQRSFLAHLAEAYPFEKLRRIVAKQPEPDLTSRLTYMRWMYTLLKELSDEIGVPIRSYKGYAHHVAYYKSGCSRRTYHGKTCRKLKGGKFTKNRDHRKTYRVSHTSLI